MLIVDITAVHVALASIGSDLALGREALTWVVTTYTLVFGGLMALGGRLADAYGPGECCWWGSRCSHSRLWRAAWHRTARG
jgi:MFS family permease